MVSLVNSSVLYLRKMCLSLLLGGISYRSGVLIDPPQWISLFCCSLFCFFIIYMCSIIENGELKHYYRVTFLAVPLSYL